MSQVIDFSEWKADRDEKAAEKALFERDNEIIVPPLLDCPTCKGDIFEITPFYAQCVTCGDRIQLDELVELSLSFSREIGLLDTSPTLVITGNPTPEQARAALGLDKDD